MRYVVLTKLSLLLATFLLPGEAFATTATPSCACTPTALATPLPTAIGPRITLEPAALTLECRGSFTIRISNSGSPATTLIISKLDIANGYEQGYYGLGFSWDASAIQLPASLPSGATLEIPVAYSSAAAYPSLLHVTIDSNATNSPHLFVTYVGLLCATPTPTGTPTLRPGDLGYKSVDGIVYDAAVGPTLPIEGAQVDYTHSSIVNPGGTGTAITDAQGRFGLFLFLHDPDTILIQAQAPGFQPRSVQFSGLQLWFDAQPVELGLELIFTHTVTATPTSTPTPGPTWSNVGPAGTTIDALVIDPQTPTTLYAAGRRIYKSTDGGASWHDASAGISSLSVGALAIDPLMPSTLYAGTVSNYARSNGGVFKTTDAGLSWHQMNGGLHGFTPTIPGLAIDPIAPSTVYATVASVGSAASDVEKTIDGAATWIFPSPDLRGRAIYTLAIDPVAPTNLYSGTEDGVFRSVDGAASWQNASAGLTVDDVRSLALAPSEPRLLLAGTTGGVFASDDGADSWHEATTGLTDSAGRPLLATALAIDPLIPTTWFAGTADGVFKTTNAGDLWIPSVYSAAAALAIDPATPTIVYAGGVGVLKSIDAGMSWSNASYGMPVAGVAALAIDPVHPGTRYVATLTGVLKSIDGVFWRQVNQGLIGVPVFGVVIDPHDTETVYAATEVGVFKSTDGAASWLPMLGYPLGDALPVTTLVAAPTIPPTLYADAFPRGLFKSVDAGNSWSLLTSGLSGPQQLHVPVVDPMTPATIYASGVLGILKSTDGGAHWSATGLGEGAPLAVDPISPETVYATGIASVSKSTDGGVSWHAVDEGLPATVRSLTIDPSNPNTLYVGTENGVFKSSDGGAGWSGLGSALPDASVAQVVLDPVAPTTIYAATGLGLFALQQSDSVPTPTSTSTSSPMSTPRLTATTTPTTTAQPTVTATPTRTTTPIVTTQLDPSRSTQRGSGGGCAITTNDPHAADLVVLGLPIILLRRRIRLVSDNCVRRECK